MLACAAPATATQPSLCHSGETVLFSCRIGSGLASVCGVGTAAVLRVDQPGGAAPAQLRGLHRAQEGSSGGGEIQLSSFDRGTATIVFNRKAPTSFGAGGHLDAQTTSGVARVQGGRTISVATCAGPDVASFDPLVAEIVPRGRFLAHD